MAYTPPWQRVCDCRCIVHHHLPRTTYTEHDCACAITCATQPITLLAGPLECALFLDQEDTLWHVPAMATGNWDWANATQVDSRSEFFSVRPLIAHLLRRAPHLFRTSLG